jgi:hypothetical protein
LSIERIICPHCNRALKSLNTYHYCKEVNIDDLFFKKPDEVLLVFDKLLQEVAEWDDVDVSATKNCVVFVRNKTFLVAKPMTKFLEVKFYAKEVIEDGELYKCHLWNSKYEGIVRLRDENELTAKHIQYFKESYLIS